jgi:hypothetical protein
MHAAELGSPPLARRPAGIHHGKNGLSPRGRVAIRYRPAALLLGAIIIGCATPVRGPGVPVDLTERATVLGGLPNARYFADTQVPEMTKEALAALDRERAQLGSAGATGPLASTKSPLMAATSPLPPVSLLAVSGGADDGAFGAGLLIGWTERGDRPEFNLVTGVSTGALIAPFAFLGSSYDNVLQHVYTEVGPSDVFQSRIILMALFNDALKDTTPLYRLISQYIDDQLMAAIAREYQNGRLLLIGTTDLDAQRPVIWNVGAIAASGRSGAVELLRKILLASAAIPAVFPPVLIDVEVDGKPYQEMHVDGGAIAQMFLYPQAITAGRDLRTGPLARERHAYVIRNGRLDAQWSSTDRRVLSIAGRAIDTMIHTVVKTTLFVSRP